MDLSWIRGDCEEHFVRALRPATRGRRRRRRRRRSSQFDGITANCMSYLLRVRTGRNQKQWIIQTLFTFKVKSVITCLKVNATVFSPVFRSVKVLLCTFQAMCGSSGITSPVSQGTTDMSELDVRTLSIRRWRGRWWWRYNSHQSCQTADCSRVTPLKIPADISTRDRGDQSSQTALFSRREMEISK